MSWLVVSKTSARAIALSSILSMILACLVGVLAYNFGPLAAISVCVIAVVALFVDACIGVK